MALGAIRISNADVAGTNVSGNNYAAATQSSATKAIVYEVVVHVRAAVAADRFLCLFDTAAGSGSSVAPVLVLPCPYGLTAQLSFSTGIPFNSGLYAVVATGAPADANSTVTAGSANDAVVTIAYRKL
jgi:hypothetical protein